MTFFTKSLGKLGEDLALNFLREKGFSILDQNFSCKVGEIDIIAKKEATLHFIEVKTRVGIQKGFPYEAVNTHKIRHLKRALQFYLLKKSIKESKLSLDVVSIILDNNYSIDKLDFFENITQ